MKTKLRFVSVLLPLILIATPLNAATTKAGATCKKIGAVSISGGKKFTCIKSGKKFIWNKGTAFAPAAAKPPTPSQTPTAIPAAIPAMPLTFQDLSSNIEGIRYWAWAKTRKQLEEGTSRLGEVKILIGPNTTPIQPDKIRYFELTSKLFSKFSQVKTVHVLEYNQSDLNWAQAEYQKLQDQTWRSNYLTKASEQCPDKSCRNASAELNDKGEAILLIGGINQADQATDKTQSAGRYNGNQLIHEYLHSIQNFNTPEFRYAMLPPWLREGAAMAVPQALLAPTYANYLEMRKIDYPELEAMSPSYTSAWISNYLNPNPVFVFNAENDLYWRQFPNYRSYDIGAHVIEILTALKGPSAVMNMFVSVGKVVTFEDAFKTEFDLTWKEALPYISDAIALQLAEMSKK